MPATSKPAVVDAMAIGTMKSATPTPASRSTRPVSTTCSTSEARPAIMLNEPKKAASWSVSAIDALAIALNCQPATVVAIDARPITAAIACRYDDPAICRRLSRRPGRDTDASTGDAAADDRRHTRCTRPVESSRLAPTHSSSDSAPSQDAVTRVARPPTIQPRMPPPPITPKDRFASRVVRTKLASVHTCMGASAPKTPTHR